MNARMVSGILMLLVIGATVLVAGCEKRGPAERAGKKVDRVIDDLKDAVDHATE